ncbi:MAG: HAD-IC family P-type ATPase, partial [Deltaproteobacteria bacterium]|nr:HAD-IC family P-type ATPase [Deltaproteobacteria bacterium]
LLEYAKNEKLELLQVIHFESIAGRGIRVAIGSPIGPNETIDISVGQIDLENQDSETKKFLNHAHELQEKGENTLFIFINKKLVGLIGVCDPIKATALTAIEKLKQFNLHLVIATGDKTRVAQKIASQLPIDEIHAELSPLDKIKLIEDLQVKYGQVGMVGDGVNDAAALAKANIGFALSTGSDIAKESAPIVLMHGDLLKVATTFEISRFTFKIIKQNLFWAFFYNCIAIPIAAFGLLSPMIASLAMALSSFSVVTNSLRLKRLN